MDSNHSGTPSSISSPPRVKTTALTHNVEYCPVAIHNPLTNLRVSLLEGNKDHLLNQARSDLAKQDLHVQSLNKCIGELTTTTKGRAKIGVTGRTTRIH